MSPRSVVLFALLLPLFNVAQTPPDTIKSASRIVLIPYQSMMYFSDADADIAKHSRMEEPKLRNEIRNQVELNTYHQLLASFDVVSLMRASSLDGEKELNRIYAATRYALYSKEQKEEYHKSKGTTEKTSVTTLLDKFSKKSKDQTFWISDSNVMLGMIMDKEVFNHLTKKYRNNYVLFITQFEMNTSNKNTIEWTKQQYNREYVLHYNLFDKAGNLVRAEVLTMKGGGENNLNDIKAKYLIVLAQRLKEIVTVTDR